MSKKIAENRQFTVKFCLDEIDTCMDQLEKRISKEKKKELESWIRNQKATLKQIGYKGKIRRAKKSPYS